MTSPETRPLQTLLCASLEPGCCEPYLEPEHHQDAPEDCRCDLKHHAPVEPSYCREPAVHGSLYCELHSPAAEEAAT